MIKLINLITGFFILLSLILLTLSSSFFTGGCARGPFPTEIPTQTPTIPAPPTNTPDPNATPTPTPVPVKVLNINFQMNGNVNINQGYYIFAFNQPLPGQTVANPITVNSDFWTDYISLGPNQGSQFIRKERITPGDYTTDWNPTVFTFTTGTFSGKNIQIIVPFNTFVNSTDLYFNMITTDINGVPRDAIGFGLGTFSDSFNIDVNKLDTPQTITDPSNDVVLTPSPPEGFLPISTSYDIISGQIILQLQ